MPRTKFDDAERKRQGRAVSPTERGRRSERAARSKARNADRMRQERAPSRTSSADATGQTSSKKARAPWSKARNEERMREERAPSPTSSADATGQALSKKARALARIRPFVHSFAASITAPAPAQQLKCQPLAFDDSSREAATASGLAIVKVFFEDRNMERSTCACCNELKPPSRTRTVSIENGGSWLARIRTRLTWDTPRLLAPPKSSTAPKGFIRPRPLCWPGYLWLPAVWPSMSRVQSRYVEEPFARKL